MEKMRGRGVEKGSVKDKEGEESRRLTEKKKVMSDEKEILLREYEEKKNSLRSKMERESLWCRDCLIP